MVAVRSSLLAARIVLLSGAPLLALTPNTTTCRFPEKKQDAQDVENVTEHYQKANVEPDAVCSICLDDIDGDPDQSVVQIRCQHAFHEACITKWLRGRGGLTCPVCRTSVKEPEAPSAEVVVA